MKSNVVMSLPSAILCPHCQKMIASAVLRTVKVKNTIYTDANQIECPRPECAKLIGSIGVKDHKMS